MNRLARWARFLSQFEYDLEYRKTKDHANADALSRLPSEGDVKFDKEESKQDVDIVCTIKLLSRQVAASDSETLRKKTAKDPVRSQVVRIVREGWPIVLLMTRWMIFENFRLLLQLLTDTFSTAHEWLSLKV